MYLRVRERGPDKSLYSICGQFFTGRMSDGDLHDDISISNRAASKICSGVASALSMTRWRDNRAALILAACSSYRRAWASLLRFRVA